jgi:hypothetical protein
MQDVKKKKLAKKFGDQWASLICQQARGKTNP